MKVLGEMTINLLVKDHRKERNFLIWIFIISLIVRIMFIMVYGLEKFEAVDSGFYIDRAINFLKGGHIDTAHINSIGYVLFLSTIFFLFGHSKLAIIVIQVFLNSIAVILVYYIGKRFYNTLVGIFASLIYTFHVNIIFWTAYILTDTLFCIVMLLLIFCLFSWIRKGKKKYLFFSMVFFFAIAFIRVPGSIFLFFILLWMMIISEYIPRQIKILLLSIVVIVFMLVPFSLAKYVIPDRESLFRKIPFYYTIQKQITFGLQWDERGRGTGDIDILPGKMPIKIKEYSDQTGTLINLMWRKLKAYWWIYTPEMSLRHKIINILFFVPLYIFAIFGLIFSKKIWKYMLLLLLLTVSLTLTSMLEIVDYDLRYHLPVEYISVFISAYGIVLLLEKMGKRIELK